MKFGNVNSSLYLCYAKGGRPTYPPPYAPIPHPHIGAQTTSITFSRKKRQGIFFPKHRPCSVSERKSQKISGEYFFPNFRIVLTQKQIPYMLQYFSF